MTRWSRIGTLVGLAAVVCLAVAITAILSLEALVRTAVERIGTDRAKVAVTLHSVRLSLLTGRAQLEGLSVANPPGYRAPLALSVRSISAELDWWSLVSDRIVLPEVVIDGPELSFEGSPSDNNLETIRRNLAGSAESASRSPTTDPPPSRTFVIRRLRIVDTRVNVRLRAGSFESSAQNIRLKPITLEHLGDPQHPLSASDLSAKILGALTETVVGSLGKTAGGLLQKGAKEAGKTVERAVEGLKQLFPNSSM